MYFFRWLFGLGPIIYIMQRESSGGFIGFIVLYCTSRVETTGLPLNFHELRGGRGGTLRNVLSVHDSQRSGIHYLIE